MENSPEMLSRGRRAMVVVVAGAALACLPWFIRNYRQFHAVFFIRDNFGLELYTSNNSCARPTMLENFNTGCHDQTHPNNNAAIAAEVATVGEIQFNHDRLKQALAWIESNPRAFASLTGRRFIKFWFPSLYGLRYAIPTGILTIFSFAGIVMMYRNHRRAALLLSSTLFLYPLIHYVLQFEARYRYPIFWATFLTAAYAVIEVVRRVQGTPLPQRDATQEENEPVPVLK
jgi:cbb3-type cytochrome oxidase subunit 3